ARTGRRPRGRCRPPRRRRSTGASEGSSGCGLGGQRQRPAVVQGGGLVERGGAGQQLAAHVVLLVPQLAQHRRDDLLVRGPQRRVDRRAVVLDLLVQLRQPVVRDHRKHVVLDGVVHVPVQ